MSSSPLAPLVSVSGYSGKVLRIGCAHDPFKKSKKILSMTTDGNDEEDEEARGLDPRRVVGPQPEHERDELGTLAVLYKTLGEIHLLAQVS